MKDLSFERVAFEIARILQRADVPLEDVEVALTFKNPRARALFEMDLAMRLRPDALSGLKRERAQGTGDMGLFDRAEFHGVSFKFKDGWRYALPRAG